MIRDTDLDGTSTIALLELIDDSTSAIKARVVIRSNSNSDTSHFNFLVTSVTDEGNHHHINGTYVSGSAFDSNEIVAFDFFVTGDKGDTGQTGPATQLSVTSTTTGAAGTSASVIVSGTAPVQSLAFTIPQGIQGIQGIQGPTGSSGATALLTGYVSGSGTVAATDTVIQAVGKLNGNDELKAPIASLYPYIGGKLLTYLDEEAAIADPLISAGDIYRKSAGGVDYVNPDNVPSLDLRFATDKTLTARRGPTPTFSRGSGATYIGSDGLIHGVDTSTTSNSIGTGSRTFTLDATAGQDQFWRTGDAVEASNGSNIMTGTVTSYTAATQSLVCNMTTASGTGTFTSWRIGYRGPRFDHAPVSRTNLTVKSDDFGAGEWNQAAQRNLTVTANNTASPSGVTDADLLTVGATTTVYQVLQALPSTGNVTSGTAYTVSCFFKPNQVTRVSIWAGNTVTLPADAMFDLTGSGSVVANAFGTASIQQYPNGWYRCIITGTAGATSNTSLRISPVSGTSRTYAGNSVDSFWAWGVQLEAGSFPTSYIPTTTAPVTIHDCRGLLIEEGRTNLFSSTNLNDWTAARVTRTAITGIGLTNQANTLTISDTGGSYIVRGATLTTGVAYAISLRVKAGTIASVSIFDLTDGKQSRGFNPVTNQWAASGGAVEFTNYTVTPNIDGWFLVSAIYTPTGTNGVKNIAFILNSTTLGQTVSFDTPQIEAGSFPTSYIPTTTGTLARGADVCSITGSNFNNFYNQSEGTFLSSTQLFSVGNDYFASYWNVFNTPSYMRVSVYSQTSTQEASYLQNNDGTLYSIVASELSRISRTAGAYQLNNARIVKNGTLGVLDTTFTPYSNLISLTIMSQASGTINSLRYYRKRLPDAKLQALTV
jgi:hypothetical protein